MTILNLIRPEFASLVPYRPGGDELKNRLHANELPKAPLALLDLQLNQYPDYQLERELQSQLASYYQASPEQIALTRGSDDGIDLLMRLFLVAGQDSILQCPPTFPMYSFYAQLQNAAVINCPLDIQDFSLNLDQLFSSWQPGCKIVMICRPNNPTGNCLDIDSVALICEQFANKAAVVVDEAYIDFSTGESAVQLLPRFDNLIVLRTLSKAFGLAALRLGAVIANERFIHELKKIIPPYHLASPVLKAASLALKNQNWFTGVIQSILEERERIVEKLGELQWIEAIFPSEANFILIKSRHSAAIQIWLASHDIAIRRLPPAFGLENTLRITVGEAQQNNQLLDALYRFNSAGGV
ncbi:histidinol-phosphate aminotransferase (imidazole acetol-phosphate transaminase) [Legionella birminghamensis]|uniref:Histidinol-phosphate aminotransferase n=1 Tax=Legionella birminghamensis TaxID=28083 RepID=A0A378IAW0_9GAMM|nr:histidinol-phosphate transaminase [Legionella birminghamensis]KTC75609.1 histidinol-phosphate aminotransferase (imidazole acetol-phosphate transaminase) [Legionella birminghamensis]STX31932.1 histidinol-phosphate aminotransferase [Legionella birminghamensis]